MLHQIARMGCVPSCRDLLRISRRVDVWDAAVAAVFLLLGPISWVGAQTSTAVVTASPREQRQSSQLSEYEGVYAYHGATKLVIVAADTVLFAVIDEAKYPLRPTSRDRFLNAAGDTIPFTRGVDGLFRDLPNAAWGRLATWFLSMYPSLLPSA